MTEKQATRKELEDAAEARRELEEAAAAALRGSQHPADGLRDLSDEQLVFVASYWSQRPRESNDDILKRFKRA